MRSMKFIGQILFLMLGVVISLQAVPPVLNYAGQVSVNGQPFEGEGLFKFALVNTDGKITYWSNDGTSVNGSEPQASVKASVSGGLYSLLLGNTAIPGMGAINPQVFAQHTDAKLRVWFSDGVNGFQQLSPDRPFASVPYAFSAGNAQSAGSANIANGSVSLDMLSQDVKSQINAPIGLNRLSSEVTAKLDQNGSGGTGIAVGSIISFPSGQPAPAGFSLHQRGTPKELVWEEKAPVSAARYAYDGVEVLDGKIYFVGGYNTSAKNTAERYDPTNNTWETLTPMNQAREAMTASLNGKIYAIGGRGSSGNPLSSVEIYDPVTNSWSNEVSLPSAVEHGEAIAMSQKIFLIGGKNASGQRINQVLCLDPSSNQWTAMANMPTARSGHKLVWFENRIWAIGGHDGNALRKVESYDPISDSWQNEASLISLRNVAVAWVANDKIYVGCGGGGNGSAKLNSIETYNPTNQQWSSAGNFPEAKYLADAVVLNYKVYVIAGQNDSGLSNKVFAADLNASMAGVYDLYRKDGNASAGTPLVQAEVADGSVTGSKMADGAVSKSALDATILKYLKPEITSQPHAQMFYEGGNISLSITAEGKYLTYQWKKDGADLAGETNATFTITDANATLHDGNYSVVVSNDFGSVESSKVIVDVNQTWKKDGLIAWLPFDGNSSDMSDNKNNAIVSGNPTWSDGKISQAINLNGSDQFINLNLECPITFSISCWIKTSDDAAAITGVDQSFVYWLDNHELRFEVNNGTWKQPITYNVANTWTFTVAIYDSILNESIIYKDGDFFSKRVILNKINNSNHFVIGKKPVGSGRFFQGLIDDFRIYDRALSAAEVQALYNMGQ